MTDQQQIRVALVGIGNCASSLVQGIQYYRDSPETAEDGFVPGLMHATIGPYQVRDIVFSAAFDVNTRKVGSDLSQAIFAAPNNTIKFEDVPFLDVPVQRGPKLDGIGVYAENMVSVEDGEAVDVTRILRETGTQVLVNYLPVGSEVATRWYADRALEAGCAFINCIPVFIASDPAWQSKFQAAGVPLLGDDIKSQVGATIVHRVLTNLFTDRGVRLERTYQLNFGGNLDFYNMLERSRLESKRISKAQSVTSQLPYEMGAENVHIGPSDYVPWLEDQKWAYIRMQGRTFGGLPLNIELKMEVWDSPNSAGVVVDAIRCAKLALDRGMAGAIVAPSAYLMKSPPVQYSDDEARRNLDAFIADQP